jgi:hypothetical protein
MMRRTGGSYLPKMKTSPTLVPPKRNWSGDELRRKSFISLLICSSRLSASAINSWKSESLSPSIVAGWLSSCFSSLLCVFALVINVHAKIFANLFVVNWPVVAASVKYSREALNTATDNHRYPCDFVQPYTLIQGHVLGEIESACAVITFFHFLLHRALR